MFGLVTLKKATLLGAGTWILAISVLHAWLNLDLFRRAQANQHVFKVGFLPVT